MKDPHAQEYGRHGQKQRGIDILARRNGDPDHFVGVQCRRYVEPLKKPDILRDCREALSIKAGLKEIIFATTCPSDTKATDAAIEVEKELRAEGHDVTIALYSWTDMELKICQYPLVLDFFCPSALVPSPQQVSLDPLLSLNALADALAARLQTSSTSVPADVKAPLNNSEDPPLHAKIDVLRDLFRSNQAYGFARQGLLDLRAKEDLANKPWAKFRIETNLGAIAINLGKYEEAAQHFECAYEARPNDCNAVANLGLARTLLGRYEEGMQLAKVALGMSPRSEQAVSYLLQAAARSSWQGDPQSLIPPDLVGTVHADLGLVEFLRKRNDPEWAKKTRELVLQHKDVEEFRRADAIAVLELALGEDTFVGAPGAVSNDDVNRAASEMLAMAERCLSNGFTDQYDLLAYVNNAAVLLRLAGRQAECEKLLVRALPSLPDQTQLRRLLALSQVAQDRWADAEVTLRGDPDPESQILAAELTARQDVKRAIQIVQGIDASGSDHLTVLRWRVLGDLALRARDFTLVDASISGLSGFKDGQLFADLLRIRRDEARGVDQSERQASLIKLADTEIALASSLSRYLVAEEMRNQGLPGEAATMLEPIVDLQRLQPATRLYLECLVAARRDEAFRKSLASSSSEVQADPEILWLVAAHAWNIGDLPDSRRAIDRLLALRPESPSARLLKIEILLRSDNINELQPELDRPIERLAFRQLSDKLRVASLLGHFGHLDRAISYAYRLFLENRGVSPAWLTFHGLVLQEGIKTGVVDERWDPKVVGDDTAVDLEYEDGEKQFIIVEPNPELRRLDDDSWEPDHLLIQGIKGLPAGAEFINPVNGKTGKIKAVRHKYIAKHHFVLAQHETRFPSINAIRSMPIDPLLPEGLDALLEELKARHDWVEQEQENYQKTPLPLAILAQRLGGDTIEVAEGLAAQGIRLKVALGSEIERNVAISAIVSNKLAGCVLDLHSFWTCWRLGALSAVMEVCGPIHIAQDTIDQLQARRERMSRSANSGSMSARHLDGKIVITEITPDFIQPLVDEIDKAIEWMRAHAIICPQFVPEIAPAVLRDFVRHEPNGIFDSLVLAMERDLLLITDDLPTRDFGRHFGLNRSTWLQPVFMVASNRKKIEFDTYVRWISHLAGAGHNYVCVSGPVLIRAAEIDSQAGECPGYFFKKTALMIGGAAADPASHIRVVLEFLSVVWLHSPLLKYRESATGLLLEELVRERTSDYGRILRTVVRAVARDPALMRYIGSWIRGHFIKLES